MGSRTLFLSAQEFALQSAGQVPHRLGRGTINTDFGCVDDSSVYAFGGHAVEKATDLPPLGGYGLGPDMDACIKNASKRSKNLSC